MARLVARVLLPLHLALACAAAAETAQDGPVAPPANGLVWFAPTLAVVNSASCSGSAFFTQAFTGACDTISFSVLGASVRASAQVWCTSPAQYALAVFAQGCGSSQAATGTGTSGACDVVLPSLGPISAGVSASVTCAATPLLIGVCCGAAALVVLLCVCGCCCCRRRRRAAASEPQVLVLQERLLVPQGGAASLNAPPPKAWGQPPPQQQQSWGQPPSPPQAWQAPPPQWQAPPPQQQWQPPTQPQLWQAPQQTAAPQPQPQWQQARPAAPAAVEPREWNLKAKEPQPY